MKKLPFGLLISLLIHAALYGGALAWMAYGRAHAEAMDIDLRGSSLILRPHNAAQVPANAVPPQPWVLASGRLAPLPQALTFTPKATTEAVGVACPPPCPANPSDWVVASAAAQAPRLIGELIDPEEIPREERGQQHRVDVVWFIDPQGNVVDVTILGSTSPALTALVLKKVKQVHFHPGLDAAGNPVSVRMHLPIDFGSL